MAAPSEADGQAKTEITADAGMDARQAVGRSEAANSMWWSTEAEAEALSAGEAPVAVKVERGAWATILGRRCDAMQSNGYVYDMWWRGDWNRWTDAMEWDAMRCTRHIHT